ncbi:RCC1 domain-containing protein [Chryseobacterium sp. CT-SW4]|uniref:RCC1 domain-containing protein n=1 Tax=Chryseobacterium sp. SW-1 TaxID=3157343 RepID=UPI003B02D4E7
MKKKIYAFSLILVSLFVFGQVGIGEQPIKGALHLKGQFPADGTVNDSLVRNVGMVLPKIDTLSDGSGLPNALTPSGGTAIEGTLVYDAQSKCVRVKNSDNSWQDCLVDNSSISTLFDYDVYGGLNVRVKKAVAGNDFSIVLNLDDNAVYASGQNSVGKTGVGNTSGTTATYSLILAKTVVDIGAGDLHGLAARTNGELWSWGEGANYRTGHGNTGDKVFPMKVKGWPATLKAVRVEGGYLNSLILTDAGKVYGMGASSEGTMGNGINSTSAANSLQVPTEIANLSAYTMADISLSRYSAAGLTTSGEIYVWGNQTQGRLGTGASSGYITPTQILAGETFKQVAMGSNHGLAVTADGKKLYAWGATRAYGTESTTFSASPVDVTSSINSGAGLAADEEIVSVAVSRFDTTAANTGSCIVITNKNIYASGSNTSPQRLGLGFFTGTTAVKYSPGSNTTSGESLSGFVPMYDKAIYEGTLFQQASIGVNHSLMVQTINSTDNSGGYGYGTGSVNYNQLGAVSTGFTSLPIPMLIKK